MISSVIFLLFFFWISTFISCIVINARIVVDSNTSRISLQDKEAEFGKNVPTEGIIGLLVPVKPINACSPVLPVPKAFLYNYRYFFALIEEANCECSHQALMVQNAGYNAAIVYRKTSNSLVNMKGGKDAGKIHIPCVNIARTSGNILKRYDYTTKTQIELLPSLDMPIELYLIPFLVVFGVCFLFMAIFSIARYCRYRSHLVNSRLSKESLKCIPTKKFKKGDENDICAICLDEFEVGDKLRVLPCSHVYHCKCIDPWLTGGKKSCPVCNRSVTISKMPKKKRRCLPSVSSTTNSSHAENESEDNQAANERTPLLAAAQPSAVINV